MGWSSLIVEAGAHSKAGALNARPKPHNRERCRNTQSANRGGQSVIVSGSLDELVKRRLQKAGNENSIALLETLGYVRGSKTKGLGPHDEAD